jgi:hypothetical protein
VGCYSVRWGSLGFQRERGEGLARAVTGQWGTGVSPRRCGDADWGCRVERVRERGVRSWARFASGSSLPSVHPHETKRIREGERRVAG